MPSEEHLAKNYEEKFEIKLAPKKASGQIKKRYFLSRRDSFS